MLVKSMNNIFLNIRDFNLLKEMMELADLQKNFKIVGITTNIIEKPNMLLEFHSDVLIIQYSIDDLKSLALLEFLLTHDEYKNIYVIMLFEELTNELIQMMNLYNVHKFFVKPYDARELIDVIQSRPNIQAVKKQSHGCIENLASNFMIELGLPTHLLGFTYIRSAAIIVIQEYRIKRLLMHDIYEKVAHIHHTTAVRVEKCMRTTVNFAYRNQPEKICIHHTKPTSSQIILYVSECLRLIEL